jgi:hypothetical protein
LLEELESRLVPSFTTTTLPLVNLTGLDLGKHSLWVAGFSPANHLFLNSSGHFQDAAGENKVPVDRGRRPVLLRDAGPYGAYGSSLRRAAGAAALRAAPG